MANTSAAKPLSQTYAGIDWNRESDSLVKRKESRCFHAMKYDFNKELSRTTSWDKINGYFYEYIVRKVAKAASTGFAGEMQKRGLGGFSPKIGDMSLLINRAIEVIDANQDATTRILTRSDLFPNKEQLVSKVVDKALEAPSVVQEYQRWVFDQTVQDLVDMFEGINMFRQAKGEAVIYTELQIKMAVDYAMNLPEGAVNSVAPLGGDKRRKIKELALAKLSHADNDGTRLGIYMTRFAQEKKANPHNASVEKLASENEFTLGITVKTDRGEHDNKDIHRIKLEIKYDPSAREIKVSSVLGQIKAESKLYAYGSLLGVNGSPEIYGDIKLGLRAEDIIVTVKKEFILMNEESFFECIESFSQSCGKILSDFGPTFKTG